MYHTLDRQIDNNENEESDDDREESGDEEVSKRGMVYPLRVTKKEGVRHVNLLLTEKDGNWHYSSIKNFSGFIRAQYSKHCGKTFYCYTCLHGFQAKKNEKSRKDCKLLKEHTVYCKQQKPQRVSYPPKDKKLEFTNIKKMLKQPFVGYADFECLLKKETVEKVKTGITDTHEKEVKYQSHEVASYFTKFTSIDPHLELPKHDGFEFPQKETYVGEDAAEHFLDYVQNVAAKIHKKYIEKPKPMVYNMEIDKKFKAATACHICEENFKPLWHHCHNETDTEKTCDYCIYNKKERPVRDHCHIQGVS